MKSYHIVAVSVGVVMVAFSVLSLISCVYCFYLMCKENRKSTQKKDGTEPVNMDKTPGYSGKTTKTVPVEDKRNTRLPSSTSVIKDGPKEGTMF